VKYEMHGVEGLGLCEISDSEQNCVWQQVDSGCVKDLSDDVKRIIPRADTYKGSPNGGCDDGMRNFECCLYGGQGRSEDSLEDTSIFKGYFKPVPDCGLNSLARCLEKGKCVEKNLKNEDRLTGSKFPAVLAVPPGGASKAHRTQQIHDGH
jgi:hypothetical protein